MEEVGGVGESSMLRKENVKRSRDDRDLMSCKLCRRERVINKA
jgi:hypothetical protein